MSKIHAIQKDRLKHTIMQCYSLAFLYDIFMKDAVFIR
jgi:hypothetical protein